MRRWFLAATAGVSLAIAAGADGPPPKKDDAPKIPVERLKAIEKGIDAARVKFYKAMQDLDVYKKEDAEIIEKLLKGLVRKQDEELAKALEIAKADPKSDAAFAALRLILTTPWACYGAVYRPALELATEYHAANPEVALIVWTLARPTSYEAAADSYPAAIAFLKAVVERNPNRVPRAWAAMGLAGQSVRNFAAAESKKSPDADKLAGEVEKELEKLLKEYDDEKIPVVGEWAKDELFELRYLRIGKVAPDIEGEDLDGVKFKLSDYRGKVVLLDFWGDWWDPCRAMYPYERSLVEKMKDKPFALVGVNSDHDKAKLKKRREEEKITWRSFWNGPKGHSGPISKKWNVQNWPTLYILDHKGVIRYKWLGFPGEKKMDAAIEELMKEAE